jgi:hypothetical protein
MLYSQSTQNQAITIILVQYPLSLGDLGRVSAILAKNSKVNRFFADVLVKN